MVDLLGVNNECTFYRGLRIDLGGYSNHCIYINSLLPAVVSGCPDPVLCCPIYIFRPPKFSNLAASYCITARIFAPAKTLSGIQGMCKEDIKAIHRAFTNVRDFEYISLGERTYPYDYFCHMITLGMTCLSTVFERAIPVGVFQDLLNVTCNKHWRNFSDDNCIINRSRRSNEWHNTSDAVPVLRPVTRGWLARCANLISMLRSNRVSVDASKSWAELVLRLVKRPPFKHSGPNDRLVIFLSHDIPLHSPDLFLHSGASSRDVPSLRKGWLKRQKRWFYPMRRPGLAVAAHAKRLVYVNPHYREPMMGGASLGLFGLPRRGRPRKLRSFFFGPVNSKSKARSRGSSDSESVLDPAVRKSSTSPLISTSTQHHGHTTDQQEFPVIISSNSTLRRRGRPRKKPDKMVGSDCSISMTVAEAPKKRGRPRKEAHSPSLAEETDSHPNSAKTFKKAASMASQINTENKGFELELDMTVSRKRTSLALLNSIQHGTSKSGLSTVMQPVKRRRGRPRKNVSTLHRSSEVLGIVEDNTVNSNHNSSIFTRNLFPVLSSRSVGCASGSSPTASVNHVSPQPTDLSETKSHAVGSNSHFANPALPSIWWPHGGVSGNGSGTGGITGLRFINVVSRVGGNDVTRWQQTPSQQLVQRPVNANKLMSFPTSSNNTNSPAAVTNLVWSARPQVIPVAVPDNTANTDNNKNNDCEGNVNICRGNYVISQNHAANNLLVLSSTGSGGGTTSCTVPTSFPPLLPTDGNYKIGIGNAVNNHSVQPVLLATNNTTNSLLPALVSSLPPQPCNNNGVPAVPAQLVPSLSLFNPNGQQIIICCPSTNFSNVCTARANTIL